jgi:uncharacterized protein YjbJ (UPF0337 family)
VAPDWRALAGANALDCRLVADEGRSDYLAVARGQPRNGEPASKGRAWFGGRNQAGARVLFRAIGRIADGLGDAQQQSQSKEFVMKDQVRGKAEEVKGKLTGNRGEEMKGKARQKVGNVKRAVRDVKKDVRDEVNRKRASR